MKILYTLPLNAVATTIVSAGVIDHFNAGSGAPGSQGWTPNSGILSGATATDLGQKVWQMTGNNCCGYWSSSLTSQQGTDAFTYGWSLRGTVRVASGASYGYLVLDVPTSFPRYDISFGVNSGNAWAGLSAWVDAANPALKHTFSDSAFHLIDMRYDPLTQTAGLWADGVKWREIQRLQASLR